MIKGMGRRFARRLALWIVLPIALLIGVTVGRSEYIPDQTALRPMVVPLHVHFVRGMDIDRDGRHLTNWLRREDVEATMPAINAIWGQASIVWELASSDEVEVGTLPERQHWIDTILTTDRLSPRAEMSARNAVLERMGDRLSVGESRFDVFVVPYLGWTISGETAVGRGGRTYVFLSAWTDNVMALIAKPAPRGLTALKRAIPLEPASLIGERSLSRTAAHELGHALGLQHHTCERECLMGGTISSGVRLTPYQIKRARSQVSPPGPLDPLLNLLETLWLWAKWGSPA